MFPSSSNILEALNSRRKFNRDFNCYPVVLLPGNERQDVERGGKIILPPSALDRLSRLNITYPMLFKLTNKTNNRISHCGVLEFVAEEDLVYMPSWMMHNLELGEGDLVSVENILLPVATYARFQPRSPDFLDISNPKAVLENTLRQFACLSTGDVFAISYNRKKYEVSVLETQPGSAVCIIECDMNVDFTAPVGYQEPMSVDDQVESVEAETFHHHSQFVPFSGTGNVLDKKKLKNTDQTLTTAEVPKWRGVPDFKYKVGTLQFMRRSGIPLVDNNTADSHNQFQPFSGLGHSF